MMILILGSIFGARKADTDLDPTEFESQWTADSEAILLDVRTPGEFRGGFIPEAVNIDFTEADFKDRIGQLDRNKSYYVYCRSGNRSGQAVSLMKNMGFENCYNLNGGISAWRGPVSHDR